MGEVMAVRRLVIPTWLVLWLAVVLTGATWAVNTGKVHAEGWRPEVDIETDAEWLTRLDKRLAPVHASLAANLELIGIAGTDAEVDAYVTLIQEQARKGIGILDSMEPARACSRDYFATERVLFLMFGDSVDAFRQFRAGSSQASAEVSALVPAAAYILSEYGDTIRADVTCEVAEPEPTASPDRALPGATLTPERP